MNRFFKFLSSLKLAVFVILSLAIVSAVGTVYEARYDAEYAQKVVYHSFWMITVLGVLCINLTFVMIDRWPWKKHHTGFIFAHIGIIITLFGALITQKLGIDGSMAFPLGSTNRFITLPDREVSVFVADSQSSPRLIHRDKVDFFDDDPEKAPYTFEVNNKSFKIDKYYHYAFREEKLAPSEKEGSGPALRFQLENSRVNLSEWIHISGGAPFERIELGPANIVLDNGNYKYQNGNLIIFTPIDDKKVKYKIYLERKGGLIKEGTIQAGDFIPTGWMDLTLRFLKYYPRAEKKISYTQVERPTPLTESAVRFHFDGGEYWAGLNDVMRLFTNNMVYYFSYANERHDVGFNIRLVDFKVGRYQGTRRAATYESDVFVKDLGKVHISMNEPMKHNGFTFYQASFEEDDAGQPTMSVLSVNKDPGRFLKYLGSFLLVLGSIILFYDRRMKMWDYFTKEKK